MVSLADLSCLAFYAAHRAATAGTPVLMWCVQARTKIAKRGQQIGLDFDGEVKALEGAADWDAELASVRDPSLQLPTYYTQPFHAYPEGNLCWEAALQVCGLHSNCIICILIVKLVCHLCLECRRHWSSLRDPVHVEWNKNASAQYTVEERTHYQDVMACRI